MKNTITIPMLFLFTTLLSSCATLKPIDKEQKNGYLLAPTNTDERFYDNVRTSYLFNFRFGVIEQDGKKVNYFNVKGNSPEHGVIKSLPPGSYRLISSQTSKKSGTKWDMELLPNYGHFPFYESFEFNVAAGEITVLPWYFGIVKSVSKRYKQDNEFGDSRPLTFNELCQPIAEKHATWVNTWRDSIEYFSDYLNANRVTYNGVTVPNGC